MIYIVTSLYRFTSYLSCNKHLWTNSL